MADSVDLNALRETLLRNQGAGQERPSTEANKVYVDPNGQIVMGNDGTKDNRTLSEVPQTVFAR